MIKTNGFKVFICSYPPLSVAKDVFSAHGNPRPARHQSKYPKDRTT
jgi:hypothetical protein